MKIEQDHIIEGAFGGNVRVSLWDRLRWWWRGRKRQACDGCAGTFRLRELCPTSGDWWLCGACMDRLFEIPTPSQENHEP